jgi:mRNA interferase MazF
VRPIHTAQLDKARPVVVLTRELVRPHMARVTVAPITTTVRGLSTEIPVGPANGLDKACVVSCDNIVTVPTRALGRQIGYLLPAQETALTEAIHAAFDLD